MTETKLHVLRDPVYCKDCSE